MRTWIFFATLFLASPANAANTQLNAYGGVDFASVTNAGSAGYRSTHLLFGVAADFGLTETFFLEPGLRYVEKGFGIKGDTLGLSLDIDIKIKYLEIPLYAKLQLMEGKIRPYLFAGPNFGIKVGDSIGFTIVSSGTTVSGRQSGSLGDAINSVNLCVDGGLGADFDLSESMGALVRGAYSLGVTNIIDSSSSKDSASTRDIQAYAGVYFKL